MKPSPQRPLIALDAVTFRYPKSETDALSGVSLEIPQGSFFALLGPNGAGKTTLLRLLCGRFSRFSGTLNVSVDVRGENGFLDPLACGILLENPGIYPKLSIAEYIDYFVGFFAARSASWNEAVVRERIASLAKKLDLPSLETRMSALSLGNRQKVQLLRAMAPKPRLLILDEPTAGLDKKTASALLTALFARADKQKQTLLVITHDLTMLNKFEKVIRL
jgi:ABC-2 type transport system ATP-binding protein